MATASASLLRLSLLRPPPPKTQPNPRRRRLLPPSSLTPSLPPSLKFEPQTRRPAAAAAAAAAVRASYSPTPATDRLISAAAYTLPFFNSLQYGRFLFLKYPSLSYLFDPVLPLLSLYKSVPYASFVAFFALYLGVVRNPSFSHYVRFNAMQAVTLDVLLVLPLLLQRILSPGRAGLAYRVMVWGHNAVFVFSAACFLYSLASSILGRTPYLPFVAGAAGRQL